MTPSAEQGGLREELVELVFEHVGPIEAGAEVESVVRSEVLLLVDEILSERVRVSDDLDAAIAARISDIDTLVSAQVNEVLHAREFQELEATWRGLDYLVHSCEEEAPVHVRILDATKAELLADLEMSPEFDQSALFLKVYEEEYGMLGGHPFGVLVGDYRFDASNPDVALLERVSNVAAAAHAPFLAAASAEFFGWESYSDLHATRSLSRIFDSAEYAAWNSFRKSDDARYVGLVLPAVLLRDPYTGQDTLTDSFCFEEDVASGGRGNYLFGNGAFALAGRICGSFARHHWCASICGVEGGGLVDDLVAPDFGTDAVGVAVRGPTETDIGDLREKELAELGFVPVLHAKGTGSAVIYSAHSCHQAKSYDTEEATASARLGSQLQYTLSVSRFAHYVKVIVRDKVGSFVDSYECEDFLNRWITDYCLGNPEGAGLDARARKPLRDAKVEVRASKSRPGHYEAVVHMSPHFQLDELTASLRLVTTLPNGARS